MWITAQMLRTVDFVFHRVTAAAQRGNSKILLLLQNSLFLLIGLVQSIISLSHTLRTLDVGSSNMTFGGLRTIDFILLHPAHIKSHDFVGCIRNIHVNGIQLTPRMALAAYNILDR